MSKQVLNDFGPVRRVVDVSIYSDGSMFKSVVGLEHRCCCSVAVANDVHNIFSNAMHSTCLFYMADKESQLYFEDQFKSQKLIELDSMFPHLKGEHRCIQVDDEEEADGDEEDVDDGSSGNGDGASGNDD